MGADENNGNGQRPSAGRVAVGHPVDVASGTLFHDFQDRILPGRMPLVFGRRYSSALSARAGELPDGMFGPGWASPFEMRILRDLEGYRMVAEDGEGEVAFEDFAGLVDRGATLRNPGAFAELRREGDHLVVTRWDPEGGEVVRLFFAIGRDGAWWPLVSRRYVDGHGIDVEHDRQGRVSVLRQRRERRGFRLVYDGAGRVAEVYLLPSRPSSGDGYSTHVRDRERQRSERPLLRYRYDARGLLAQVTDALENSAHYAYDEAGRMTREVNIGGMVYLFGYDADGRCVMTTGQDEYGRNDLAIDTLAKETRVTDSLGHVTTYRWNENGQVEQEISPLGHVTQTVYDEFGRIVQGISPGGATTSYAYDERGDRVSVTDPNGAVTRYAYDDRHQVVRVTDPLGHETRREFDAEGRVVGVSNALGHTYRYEYSQLGDLISVINPKGHQRRLQWDGAGDLVGQTDYLGHRTALGYSAEGHVTAVTDQAGYRTEALVDALGRVREVRLPDGARRRYAWNAYDQLTGFTDERGVLTEIRYAYCGLATELIRPHGGRVRFEWSSVPGQLLAVQNERDERYTFEYDVDGRMRREVDFAGRTTGYEYDPDGQVARVENNAGQISSIGRDGNGNVTEVLHDDGSQTTFEYDPRGFIVRADNGQCLVERAYDALGRLVLEKQDGIEIASTYDETGNRILRRSSLGSEVHFEWSPDGQLLRLAPRESKALVFAYDARRNEVQREVEGGVRIEHSYDSRGRIAEQFVRNPAIGASRGSLGLEAIVHRQYHYDAAGNLIELLDDRWGAARYAYDQLGRIVSAQVARVVSTSFAYDATDNLVEVETLEVREAPSRPSQQLHYAAGNTLVRKGEVVYEYDRLGQRIGKRDAAGTTQYRWNRSGQLVEVQLPDGAVWRYRYDAFSRRIEKQGPFSSTRFVWDREVVLHEVSLGGDGQPQRVDWEFEPHGFAPICKAESQRTFLAVNNVAGAPHELVAEDGGVGWAARLDAFGWATEESPSDTDCPVRLQGQWYDEETKLCYNRFRFYDAHLGRYISADPLRLAAGVNTFVYPPNAFRWTDPLGLTKVCPQSQPPNHFPDDPNEMTRMLGVEPRISTTPDGTPRYKWQPSENVRIRYESHPHGLAPGDPGWNPRHHGPHYHVEFRAPGTSWNQGGQKAHPPGYTPGSGTGFLPGEAFPGSTN